MKSWRTLIHLPVWLHYVIKWANVQQTNGTRAGAPQNWQTSGFLPCTNVIFQNINTLPKTPRLADAVSPGGCVFVIMFTDKRDSYSAVVSDQFKQVEFSFKSRVNRANQKPLYAVGLFSLTYRVSDSKNLCSWAHLLHRPQWKPNLYSHFKANLHPTCENVTTGRGSPSLRCPHVSGLKLNRVPTRIARQVHSHTVTRALQEQRDLVVNDELPLKALIYH